MTLRELKENILAGTLSNELLIFKYEPATKFLVNQYIDELCVSKNLIKNYVSSFYEVEDSAISFIMDYSSNLNIIDLDELTEFPQNTDGLTNVVVLCEKIDKRLKKVTEPYVVEFSKILPWQAIAYMTYYCPGLDQEDYEWLYEAAGHDMYRVVNELDKLLVFDISSRRDVFISIKLASNSDLYEIDSFKLVDFIINNNKTEVIKFLKHKNVTTVTALGLVALLLNKYKKLLYVKFGSAKDIASFGISAGEKYYLSKNYTIHSQQDLLNKIKFLASIDSKLKNGLLDLQTVGKDYFIDYILVNIMK